MKKGGKGGGERQGQTPKELSSHKGMGFLWWARESLIELKRES